VRFDGNSRGVPLSSTLVKIPFKEAITIKFQNQMTLLVPDSMCMETQISPDDPKHFYFSLKKILYQLWQIQSKLNYQGSLKNLLVLNAYPIIKKLFFKYNTPFQALLSK
jgi:hypothetical protein